MLPMPENSESTPIVVHADIQDVCKHCGRRTDNIDPRGQCYFCSNDTIHRIEAVMSYCEQCQFHCAQEQLDDQGVCMTCVAKNLENQKRLARNAKARANYRAKSDALDSIGV